MDLLHENSVAAIESLQKGFHQQSDLFFMISNVFDPRYAFLVYSPLIFALDWSIGKKVMWVTIIAEWSNQILKWMLHGERPYWWVHETQVYNRTGVTTPEIQQYFLTCETGPGSPSGHSMVAAAVWYVILESFLQKLGAVKKNSNNLIAKVCWLAYLVVIFTVGVSRVYIAAHFPHQCVMGMAIGCAVAMAMDYLNTDNMKTSHYVLATGGLLGSALSTFAVLKAMGMNPLWSVDRAVKWCANPAYIHIDTTPFFSMMRYCGFTLGIGLGFNSNSFQEVSKETFTTSMKVIAAVLSVGLAKLSERIELIKGNTMFFYAQAFALNAVLPYIMIAIIPLFVYKVWPRKMKQH